MSASGPRRFSSSWCPAWRPCGASLCTCTFHLTAFAGSQWKTEKQMESTRILTLKMNDLPGCVLTVRNNIDALEILDSLIRDSRAEWELQWLVALLCGSGLITGGQNTAKESRESFLWLLIISTAFSQTWMMRTRKMMIISVRGYLIKNLYSSEQEIKIQHKETFLPSC